MLIPWTLILISGYYYYSYWRNFESSEEVKQLRGPLNPKELMKYEDIRRQEIRKALIELLIDFYTMLQVLFMMTFCTWRIPSFVIISRDKVLMRELIHHKYLQDGEEKVREI